LRDAERVLSFLDGMGSIVCGVFTRLLLDESVGLVGRLEVRGGISIQVERCPLFYFWSTLLLYSLLFPPRQH